MAKKPRLTAAQLINLLTNLANDTPYYRAALEGVVIPGLAELPPDQMVNSDFLNGKIVPEFAQILAGGDWRVVLMAANEDVIEYRAKQAAANTADTNTLRDWLGYSVKATRQMG